MAANLGPRDHIKRVHLSKHQCDTNRKSRQGPEVELMTKEQEKSFLALKLRDHASTSSGAFERIYLALWPDEANVPSGYLKHPFLWSTPQIQAVLGMIEPAYTRANLGRLGFSPHLPAHPPTWLFPTPGLSNFPFANTSLGAGFGHCACKESNGQETGLCLICFNPIEENTTRGSQAIAQPLSSHNLGAQVHPDLSFTYTIPQGKSSLDSGYYSREQNEKNSMFPPAPAATTFSKGVMEGNIWDSAAAASHQWAVEPEPEPPSNAFLFPTAEFTDPSSYSRFLSEDDVDNDDL